jgi:very-short-patch-repair endonuclease
MARGQLSCADAATAHGLEVFPRTGAVHVRIPERSQRVERVPGVVLHRRGPKARTSLTDLRSTLADCVQCLPVEEAVAIWDAALRQGRVDLADLTSLAVTLGPRGRDAVELVDPAAQSVLESVARVVLTLEQLGDIDSQVFVPQVGWVDLLLDRWLVVELDGWSVHKETFREDRRRDAELSRLGFVVVRFTYQDLAGRRGWFVSVVRETLERGRPPYWFHPPGDDFARSRCDTPA